jgi:bisphosphoglycerate-dependent phosphoglycerate mutase
MIAAHGNSLRAIIMYLDSLTPEEVLTNSALAFFLSMLLKFGFLCG